MDQRIPLRHYRLFSRTTPYVDVNPRSVTLRLPQFREPWVIPAAEISHRTMTRNAAVVEKTLRAGRRYRRALWISTLGFPLAIAGKIANGYTPAANWPLVLGGAGLLLFFGPPAVSAVLSKREERRD